MNDLAPIATDGTVVKEGGSAALLPEGTKVLATILQTKKDGPAVIEKRPFATQGENASLTALGVRFVVDAGQPGAGRNFFKDIAWARKYLSTGNGKFPDGAPNYDYFGFFRSLGFDVDPVASPENPQGLFAYPGDDKLIGQKVELVLGVEAATINKKTGEEIAASNFVRFINKANGIPDNSAVNRAAAAAATASTTPGWAPGTTPGVTPVAAAAPAAGWTPPGVAAAAPAAAAGWTHDAADVAAAQQLAAAGPGF